MHVYDTLLIGCSYFSVGYAISRESCIICEEHHIADTHFYLPLKSFAYREYTPKTDEGRRLSEIFSELSLFRNGMQNTNGFECAFCRYVLESDPLLLLNCRMIGASKEKGINCATLQSNQGLTTVYAKRILDTRAKGTHQRLTVLFTSKEIEKDKTLLQSVFPEAQIEQAFYEDRYALSFCTDGHDENRVKAFVADTWRASKSNAKILYIAPVFKKVGAFDPLCDSSYENPIEAFEAGFFYAKEGAK